VKAVQAIQAARTKRAETETLSEEWDVQDHLVALNARIGPLRAIGTSLVDAAIQVHRTLWPKVQPPTSIDELATKLKGAEARLREWRSSSARAGADQALVFVLSWYEEIEIGTVTSLRKGSPWNTTPAGIEKRQAAADLFASYADTRTFNEGRAYSEDEESSDEEEESGEENSEGSDDDLDFDEPPTSKGKTGQTSKVTEEAEEEIDFNPPSPRDKSGKGATSEVITPEATLVSPASTSTEVASTSEVPPSETPASETPAV